MKGTLFVAGVLSAAAPGMVMSDTSRIPAMAQALSDEGQTQLRPRLEPAVRDPFGSALPQQSLSSAPLAPAPAPKQAPPPAPVAAPSGPPPLDLQFVGRATTAQGDLRIYAVSNGSYVLLSRGMRLVNGYTVEQITEDAVLLHYAPLNSSARLDIPPAPRFEIR